MKLDEEGKGGVPKEVSKQVQKEDYEGSKGARERSCDFERAADLCAQAARSLAAFRHKPGTTAVAADSSSPAPAPAPALALAVWLQPSTLPIATNRRARAVAACLRLAPPRNAEPPRPDTAQVGRPAGLRL
jgi:hypothetical protein